MTRAAWTRRAWAGDPSAPLSDRGGLPVPDYDARFYWTSTATSSPWAVGAFGGRQAALAPTGGLVASPDPAAGTVVVQCWWAFARQLLLHRVGANGTRTPVRFGDPFAVVGDTRRNDATNPTARDDASGYAGGTNTTVSAGAGFLTPSPRVRTAVRAAATAAGAINVLWPEPVPTFPVTYGLWCWTNFTAGSLAVVVDWYDAASASLGSTTYPVTATERAQAVGNWPWLTFTVQGQPQGAVVGQARFVATGAAAGSALWITGRVREDGAALRGEFFDGDHPGGSWLGAPGKSASTLAPISVVVDAEAPLDTPVRYELANALTPGYRALSEPVSLAGGQVLRSIRQCWLTHPGRVTPIRVWIEDEPEVTNPLEQETFKVIGRRRKVVVSDTQRGGDEGSLTFITESAQEHARLREMLDDGSPLLLRMPPELRHPRLWWLSFGEITSKPNGRHATNRYRKLSAPFVEVDRPSSATRRLAG